MESECKIGFFWPISFRTISPHHALALPSPSGSGRPRRGTESKEERASIFGITQNILKRGWISTSSPKKNRQNSHRKKYSYPLTTCFIKSRGIVIIKKAFLVLIKAYQYTLSPVLGPACRYTPTCSEYSYQAIERYGPAKGVALSVKRILRCHPFHSGGFDPVP